jgi:hypothetical protein
VSAVAARYARWYLNGRPWNSRFQWVVLAVVVILVMGIAMTLGSPLGGGSSTDKTLAWGVAIVAALVVMTPLAVRRIRLIRLYRLELANNQVLEDALAGAAAAQPAGWAPPVLAWPAPTAVRDLVVRYDVRRLRRRYLRMLGVSCIPAVFTFGEFASGAGPVATGIVAGIYAVVVLPSIVSVAVHLVRWVLPGRPLVELDARGVRLPSIGSDLPWSSLAEVRLYPMRYVRRDGQQAVAVAFVPHDPAAVLSGLSVSSRRRRRLEKSLRVYGTPLSLSDHLVSHSGAEIAAVASAYTGLPVRRY